MRHVNDATISLMCRFEGLSLKPYLDIAGLRTIGYGHRVRKGEHFDDNGITQEQAVQLLKEDVAFAEAGVSRLVRVALSDNQFGALVDFAFNLGVTSLANSSLLLDLNEGHYDRVPAHLLSWDHARVLGKEEEIAGLKRRRQAEADLWSATHDDDQP